MKKIISVLLCAVLLLSLVACSGGKSSYPDATTVMNKVWESFDEDKTFAAIGGDMGNPVDNKPGEFNISNAEDVDGTLTFPAAQIGEITEAASLMHMMNANTFTGACFRLKDGADIKKLAEAYKENAMNKQWICGIPETLVILNVVNTYLLTAYGAKDIVDTFRQEALDELEDCKVLVEEEFSAAW